MLNKINAFNERLAVWIVQHVGSMVAFWVCFIYAPIAMIPIFQAHRDIMLFASSAWAQLWLLPAIMVGQSVTGRKAETRAEEDHNTIMAEMTELKGLHKDMHDILKEIRILLKEVCPSTSNEWVDITDDEQL